MKELTIEQKAKHYDEAIERANELMYVSDKDSLQCKIVEHIFPQLKESEDLEIKSDIQYAVRCAYGDSSSKTERILAWLDKQGDNKGNISIDFVLGYLGIKPAYKDGNAWCILLGDNIQEGIYGFGDTKEEALIAFIKELIEKQGTSAKLSEEEQNRFAKGVLTSCASSFINYLDAHKYEGKMCVSNGECEDIENAFHNAMWDRLHRYYCKYIEKQGDQKPVEDVNGDDYGIDSLWHAHRILEKTLGKVDGYQTDDGILEHECAISAVKKLYEQKTAWSEEDKEMLDLLIANYKFLCKEFRDKEHDFFVGMGLVEEDLEMVNWLKDLKERVQPQTTWKPSDEQMAELRRVISGCSYDIEPLVEMEEQLKKLKA